MYEFDEVFRMAVNDQPLPNTAYMEEIGAYFALRNLIEMLNQNALPREKCMEYKAAIYRDFINVRHDREMTRQLLQNAQLCAVRAETLGVELIKRTVPGADLQELLMLAADCISHMRGEEMSTMRRTLERRLRGEFSVSEKAEMQEAQEMEDASA